MSSPRIQRSPASGRCTALQPKDFDSWLAGMRRDQIAFKPAPDDYLPNMDGVAAGEQFRERRAPSATSDDRAFRSDLFAA